MLILSAVKTNQENLFSRSLLWRKNKKSWMVNNHHECPCENQVNKVWLNSKFTLERVMSVWDKEPSKMASGLKMGPRSELASLSKELKKKFSTLFTLLVVLQPQSSRCTFLNLQEQNFWTSFNCKLQNQLVSIALFLFRKILKTGLVSSTIFDVFGSSTFVFWFYQRFFNHAKLHQRLSTLD